MGEDERNGIGGMGVTAQFRVNSVYIGFRDESTARADRRPLERPAFAAFPA